MTIPRSEFIEYDVNKISKEMQKDNFRALNVEAQKRVLEHLELTIKHIMAFKETMIEESYKKLISALKEKKLELQIIHNMCIQRPLSRW